MVYRLLSNRQYINPSRYLLVCCIGSTADTTSWKISAGAVLLEAHSLFTCYICCKLMIAIHIRRETTLYSYGQQAIELCWSTGVFYEKFASIRRQYYEGEQEIDYISILTHCQPLALQMVQGCQSSWHVSCAFSLQVTWWDNAQCMERSIPLPCHFFVANNNSPVEHSCARTHFEHT